MDEQNEKCLLLEVSFEDVVQPLMDGDTESCPECKSIMTLIEQFVTEDYPSAEYFEVDYDPKQQTLLGICDIYDKPSDDIVEMKIWFTLNNPE